jgi:hypothetical protein
MSEMDRKNEDKLLEAIYGYVGEHYVDHVSNDLHANASEPLPDIPHKKIIRAIRLEAFKQKVRRHSRWYAGIASVLVFAFIGFSVATVGVEATRDKLFTVVKEVTTQFTHFGLQEVGSRTDDFVYPPDWSEYDVPDYLPDGFLKFEAKEVGVIKILNYSNSNGGFIRFSQSDRGEIFIDSEDAAIEEIDINGLEGELIKKHGQKTLFWHRNNRMYLIVSYGVSDEELIKIAESLKSGK